MHGRVEIVEIPAGRQPGRAGCDAASPALNVVVLSLILIFKDCKFTGTDKTIQ